MKLTEGQIQILFEFTKKKLVHFYDLQAELVDHLAAGIEEQMERDARLSFEAALAKEYEKFGIFGFSKIVMEKEKQLSRQHLRMWLSECRTLFQWPGLLRSASVLAAIYTLAHTVNPDYLRIIFGALSLVFLVTNIRLIKRSRKPRKQLMMLQYYSPGFSSVWSYIYLQFLLQYQHPHVILFTLVNFVGIMLLIASYELNKKVKLKAMKQYPEAFA